MSDEKMTMTIELVNQVLGYLGKRPYDEVFQLIEKIQSEYRVSVAAKAVESQDDGPA
jgi:hypothetical protein